MQGNFKIAGVSIDGLRVGVHGKSQDRVQSFLQKWKFSVLLSHILPFLTDLVVGPICTIIQALDKWGKWVLDLLWWMDLDEPVGVSAECKPRKL